MTLCDLPAVLSMSNHHSTCRHLCFYPIALLRKPCSKHMLHCSYCNPSQSCHHIMSSFSTQEIARHLRPATLRALYGKNKVQNAVHCTDLPEDGVLEVSTSKSHSNVMQEPQSRFVCRLILLALRKLFAFKNISGSHKCL